MLDASQKCQSLILTLFFSDFCPQMIRHFKLHKFAHNICSDLQLVKLHCIFLCFPGFLHNCSDICILLRLDKFWYSSWMILYLPLPIFSASTGFVILLTTTFEEISLNAAAALHSVKILLTIYFYTFYINILFLHIAIIKSSYGTAH